MTLSQVQIRAAKAPISMRTMGAPEGSADSCWSNRRLLFDRLAGDTTGVWGAEEVVLAGVCEAVLMLEGRSTAVAPFFFDKN